VALAENSPFDGSIEAQVALMTTSPNPADLRVAVPADGASAPNMGVVADVPLGVGALVGLRAVARLAVVAVVGRRDAEAGGVVGRRGALTVVAVVGRRGALTVVAVVGRRDAGTGGVARAGLGDSERIGVNVAAEPARPGRKATVNVATAAKAASIRGRRCIVGRRPDLDTLVLPATEHRLIDRCAASWSPSPVHLSWIDRPTGDL
jgi:hypothetical protein